LFLSDSLTNIVANLGTDRDKLAAGRFVQRVLTQQEIDDLYTSDWIAGTIVDAVPDDETRTWRRWQAGQRQIGPLESAEKALGVRWKVRKARKLARKDGGSAIFLGTGDADPAKELSIDRLARGGLRYLHVFSRQEATTGPLVGDVLSPYFGEPEWYEIGGNNGQPVRVHPSRMVRFIGEEAIERTDIGGWGRTVLQRVYDTVLQAATATSSIASMTTEAKVDVFGVENLSEYAKDPNYQAKILARFALAARSKGVNGSLLRDLKEVWEQKQLNFAGLPEIARLFLDLCAGAGKMPLSRLFRRAPSGLNSGSGGDTETRAWYDEVQVGRETELEPAMARLDEALIRSALGSRPAAVHFNWEPLWQLTDAEKAEIGLKKAQATQIYAQGAFLPPSALRAGVRNQLIEDGTYPGLEAAVEAAGNEAPAPVIVKVATARPAQTE
jgi:phage-related protein (TIGR01555 family)